MSTSARPSAIPTVQIENDTVRVTEWRFPPGASTGFHRHEYDYVVVPMTTARCASCGGWRVRRRPRDRAGLLPAAGVEHEVVNDNPFEVIFVETEVK